MKKVVMALLLMAGVAGFAQEKPATKPDAPKHKMDKGPKVTPEEQAKQIAKELSLDDAQQAKVKALYAEQEKKRAADIDVKKMEKGEQHDHAAMEARMKKENAAFDTKMKGILSKEQYTKWQASLKTDHKGHGGHKKA
jgi:protein CpxP